MFTFPTRRQAFPFIFRNNNQNINISSKTKPRKPTPNQRSRQPVPCPLSEPAQVIVKRLKRDSTIHLYSLIPVPLALSTKTQYRVRWFSYLVAYQGYAWDIPPTRYEYGAPNNRNSIANFDLNATE